MSETSQNEKKLIKILLTFLIVLILLKSQINPLTYDEARTFLDYVRPKDVFKFSIANNHLVNSLSMIITSTIDNSVIMLRLPNILTGLIYIFTSYFLCIKYNNSLLMFTLFCLSPLLFEFFTLARGYGIAASCLFLGSVIYYENKDYKYSLLISSFFFTISIYSIYISSIYVFSFFAVVLWSEFKKKNTIILLVSSSIVGFSSYQTTRWMIGVKEYDAYLYGLENYNFSYFLKSIFGFGPLFNPYFQNLGSLILVAFLFIWATSFKRRILSKDTFEREYVLIFSVILLYLIPILLDSKLPQFRVLLPFLPGLLLVLSNSLNFVNLSNKKSIFIKNFLIFVLIFNFLYTFKLDNTYDWRWNKVEPKEAIKFEIDTETQKCYYPYIENPVAEYYRLLEVEKNKIYCNEVNGKIINQK